MRLGRLLVFLSLMGWLVTQLGLADIDPAEYSPQTFVRSEKERKQLQAEFETDLQKEAQLQRQQEELAVQRLAAEKAA